MIGYANDILSSGDMDIYQRTYEQLKFSLAPKKVGSELLTLAHYNRKRCGQMAEWGTTIHYGVPEAST